MTGGEVPWKPLTNQVWVLDDSYITYDIIVSFISPRIWNNLSTFNVEDLLLCYSVQELRK